MLMVVLLRSSRGLFLIDPQGVVKHMSVNDLPVGRSVEETLRLVKAFQFVETHGEVCPASWTPESPTVSSIMNRSPSKSMWTILAPVTTLSKASSYHAGLP